MPVYLYIIFNICPIFSKYLPNIYNGILELGSILRLILLDSINYTLICTIKVSALIDHNHFTWQKIQISLSFSCSLSKWKEQNSSTILFSFTQAEVQNGHSAISIALEYNNWSITIVDASPIIPMHF